MVNKWLSLATSAFIILLLVDLLYCLISRLFLRFDENLNVEIHTSGKIKEKTLKINGLHAKIITSCNTPENQAPVVIMHHGYGSNYRRMLLYAYPVALKGYAVLLYNARGHGKIVKVGGKPVDERSPGDKTHILNIMKDLRGIVHFITERDDLGRIGFIGISLGAIVGLTYGATMQEIECVIAMAGIHDFKETATRKLRLFSTDWLMKKSFEWSGLEMQPTQLQDRLVSPAFYLDKKMGFFDHPVWDEGNAGKGRTQANKIHLIHAKDDCTVPFWNFLNNKEMLDLPKENYLVLERGNHWFIKQEHLVLGQMMYWLDSCLLP